MWFSSDKKPFFLYHSIEHIFKTFYLSKILAYILFLPFDYGVDVMPKLKGFHLAV